MPQQAAQLAVLNVADHLGTYPPSMLRKRIGHMVVKRRGEAGERGEVPEEDSTVCRAEASADRAAEPEQAALVVGADQQRADGLVVGSVAWQPSPDDEFATQPVRGLDPVLGSDAG
jgi:hypothetical protein